MRTLVYEPRTGGHFLNFAGLVAGALADVGAETHVVVAAHAPGRLEYESCIAPLRERVRVHANVSFDASGSPLTTARRSNASLAAAVREIKPARVYLPTADGLVQLMGVRRLLGVDDVLSRTHVEGLLLNGAVGHPELLSPIEHWKKRASFRMGMLGCHTAFHLNPFVRDWELLSGTPRSRCAQSMPDPVEVVEMSKVQARGALGLPFDGRIVGMVGRLDGRKGAHVLVEAFLSANLGPRDLLMLWGPYAEDFRPFIGRLLARADLKERLLLRDGVLTTEQFYQAIAAMDLLALPYTSTFASSSIVIRAAAAGRPVITTSGGWAERVVSRFPMGWTFAGPDPEKLAAILPRCLEESENWVSTAKVRRFVEYNSPRNFAAHWTHGLRKALGMDDDPSLQTWQQLLESDSYSGAHLK